MNYPVTKAVQFPKTHMHYGTKAAKFICDTAEEANKLSQVKKIIVYVTSTGVSSHKVLLSDGTKIALCNYLYGQTRRARLSTSSVFDLTKTAYVYDPRYAVEPLSSTVSPQADIFTDPVETTTVKAIQVTAETELMTNHLLKSIVAKLQSTKLRNRSIATLIQIDSLLD